MEAEERQRQEEEHKRQLEQQCHNFMAHTQRFIFVFKELEDGALTVTDYGIDKPIAHFEKVSVNERHSQEKLCSTCRWHSFTLHGHKLPAGLVLYCQKGHRWSWINQVHSAFMYFPNH